MVEETGQKSKVKYNPWMIATAVLAVALVALLASGGITGSFLGGNPQSAASKAMAFINTNLLQGQAAATLINVTEKSGLYQVVFSLQDQIYTSYMTKDGSLLFPQAIELTQKTSQPPAFDAPDAEVPLAQLFVMSFCPYGQAAENAMNPVVGLLGDAATVEPHFIITVMNRTEAEDYVKALNNRYNKNYTTDSMFLNVGDSYLYSLHGPVEAAEDMRQAVIFRLVGVTKFWKYISYVNANCSISNIDTCWKAAATAAGIDSAKIESKLATDGLGAMRTDQALADSYSVSGSPTLIINGKTYTGERTSEAFKDAICSGFDRQPDSCAQTLSSTSSTSSGGCGG